MKIPGTNFELKFINLTKKVPSKDRVVTQITKIQQYRVFQDIQKLRTAIQQAEQITYPNRFLLYQTYRDVILDGHLSGLIDQRKDRIKLKEFTICLTADGEPDEKLTELFKQEWFTKFLDYAMDSIFWGYSLVQFGDITKDTFDSVELVPRLNVRPERGEFVTFANLPTGPSFKEPPFSDYAIGIGDPYDLGLLMKAAFYAITKKNVLGTWAEFTELFGIPPRILKTDVRDDKTRKSGEDMMENMSRAPWAVIDRDDELEFGQSTSKGNNSEVFLDLITECDENMSKLILGHSAVADSTSGKLGNEQMSLQVSAEKEQRDSLFIANVVHDQLFPFMRNLGFKIPEGALLVWDNDGEETEEMERQATFNVQVAQMVSSMSSAGFGFDETELSEWMGLTVTKKPMPTQVPANGFQMKQAVENKYKQHMHKVAV